MTLFKSLLATDLYVDNVKGSNKGTGAKEAPFKTITKALSLLKSGDTLHLINNEGVFYEEIIDTHATNAKWGGTAEKPTVINGHGATITGLRHFKAASWKNEGDGVFSRPLGNNAWHMDKQGFWSGHSIVFFDDKPANFSKNKTSLIDFTYFLHKDHPKKRTKLHNTLYIKIPAGKTPDDVRVVTVGTRTNIYINRSYITVKNLKSIYAGDDAFSTGKDVKCLVFDKVQGSYCMDQGISNHGAEAIVKNSTFDYNTVSGIVDVYPEAKVKYLNCVIENNGRGGVEFYSGEFSMENCIIRNNIGTGIIVNRMANASIQNCYIEGSEKKFRGIHFGNGSLTIKNCTIYNTSEALTSYMTKTPGEFELTTSTIINNRQNLKIAKADNIDLSKLTFNHNIYTPSDISVFGKNYKTKNWQMYQETTGFDTDSLMMKYEGSLPPLRSELKIGDQIIGAEI